jgi:hypothetical protein
VADIVFNVAKGRIVELANRVNANDPANSALIVVPINANAVSDATLVDLDDLAAILATAADECAGDGWNRKTLTDASSIAVTVTDGSDKVEVDCPDFVWTAVSSATAVTDLVICYDSDTTGGSDSNLVPLVLLDCAVTPNGGDITYQVNASGFYRGT